MEKEKKIRVRFAPSPTGHLHIGSLRVAIFNWLFARHYGGKYLLRVEDTDRERSKQEYSDSILEFLEWFGIDHDDQVMIQSSRTEEHKKIVDQLLKSGKAYKCYCTPEEIIERQKVRDQYNDLFSMYDRHCRDLEDSQEDPSTGSQPSHKATAGTAGQAKPFVVRFKIPEKEKTISFNDLIRGTISFDTEQFDDFIISRSDGSPVYNLVVVVDDAYMKVSHVIRGEDHISNTPKQIMLYRACGFDVPEFAHLPLILGPSGDKLSKRDAATDVTDYRKNGYLSDALFNYLVRLGWSHGDQEVFTRKELVEYFSLDHVGKKGAIFDPEKLAWLNGVYIREMDEGQLLRQTVVDVQSDLKTILSGWSYEHILKLVALYKERVKTLKELADQLLILYNGPKKYDQAAIKKWIKPETKNYLEKLIETLNSVGEFSEQNVSSAIKGLCKELEIKLVALAQPIRIALTGTSASPGVFALLELIGKEESISRIASLLNQLD